MTITLHGRPQSTNHLYKSACRGKKPVVYMPVEAVAIKYNYVKEAREQWKRPIITEPVEIKIRLFFTDNLRRDWDNWHKISMDALTGIVWKDDSQIQSATVEKHIDKLNPRIEITIL